MLLGSVADKPTTTGLSVTHLSPTSMMGVGCHGLWACLLELAAESDPVARALAGTAPHRRETNHEESGEGFPGRACHHTALRSLIGEATVRLPLR